LATIQRLIDDRKLDLLQLQEYVLTASPLLDLSDDIHV
jgi:hypothetical protein